MSIAFGPVHYWLFDQIRLVDGRTDLLLDHLSGIRSQQEIKQLDEGISGRFGQKIGDTALEELVFPPAIHQGLSYLIARIEAREAAVFAAFGDKREGLEDLYREQGRRVAEMVAGEAQNGNPNAKEIFEALMNIKLVGMPCDKVVELVSADGRKAVWRQVQFLQKETWGAGGADFEALFRHHGFWLEGFARELNPAARYEAVFFRPEGDPVSEEMFTITE